MKFNHEAFDSAEFRHPTKMIPVPWLKFFFEDLKDDEEPVLEIRPLDAIDLAVAEDPSATIARLKEAAEVLEGASVVKINTFFTKLFGLEKEDEPVEYLKWLRYVQFGTGLPFGTCVNLAVRNGMLFRQLAIEILNFSGEGADLVK